MFCEIILILLALMGLVLYVVTLKSKRDKIDFHGKHVVVTGGSSGIGLDLCIQAFKEGANVTIMARDMAKLNAAKEELESLKRANEHFSKQIIQIESIDISKNYEDTKAAFDKVASVAGPVNILVNNAGIFKSVELSEASSKDFDDMMRINYLGAVYCTKAVIDSMKSRKFGRIVMVSSQAGQIGIFGYTHYSATKFALRGFSEALQMEVKPYNIYITLAYPPDTDTPGLKEENLNKPEETRLIAEGSGVYPSKQVASEIITAIKRGSFSCSYGFNGFLLTTLTSGAGPVTTFKEAMIQILALPLCRFIAVVLLYTFDNIVRKCYKKKLKGSN